MREARKARSAPVLSPGVASLGHCVLKCSGLSTWVGIETPLLRFFAWKAKQGEEEPRVSGRRPMTWDGRRAPPIEESTVADR